MKFDSIIASALIGVSVALVQPQITLALSSGEVGKIAQGFTVLIESKNPGSGIIIKKEGNIYTVLTAAHVVDDSKLKYQIVTNDGKRYLVKDSTVKILPGVDLAVVKFTSNLDYPSAKIGNSDSVELGTTAYVAGFPPPTLGFKERLFTFNRGEINANASRPLSGGYALVYNTDTIKGMSGGPVLNDKGELIGIHGRGDRDTNQDKTGRNLGIPINTFIRVSKKINIDLGVRPSDSPTTTELNASDYFLQGKDKSDKKDYQGAIAAFTQAIRLNPKYDYAYTNRGYAHLKLGEYQRAIKDFNQALRINPNYLEAYINRGFARRRLRDYKGAIEDFNQALRINPNNFYAYFNRGFVRSKLRDYQGAIEDFNQALRINPNYAIAYYNRGLTRYYLKDYQGAIEDLNQAIRINPNNAVAYYVRGLARNYLKDYQGAIEDLNQAIRINPNNAQAAIKDLKRAANLFQKQGDTQSYQRTLNLIQEIQSQL